MDPFLKQKEESYTVMLPQIGSMAKFMCELIHRSNRDMRMEFEHLVLVSTWSGHAVWHVVAYGSVETSLLMYMCLFVGIT